MKVESSASVEAGMRVYVDGQKIHESLLRPHGTIVVEGVQARIGRHDSAVSELLWARPRLPKPPVPDRYGKSYPNSAPNPLPH